MNGVYVLTDSASFEIAAEDLAGKYTWKEAKVACSVLEDRWRLPDKQELQLMYKLHQKGIGSFKLGEYWNSFGVNNLICASLDFLNGREYYERNSKHEVPQNFVRPVRTI